mmetsp:Transcript_24716/g.24945  ORF Transcript_24716/g.24945 Transcript_24716/m.24945 type:complete len:277 (-) Transcript_24716:56-886(-)|eukprot:CAMPEP_0182418664 /NCGR_PEP_ID=MMETSP1167-20130531/3036_1 /TAXON_ID=2988 /ORGANISM="Mallomonas Sp, Strain CCMP3275" /LENGTH=276 /DNA_ID=CAMNT_0024592963 /DNA_START=68 /DNA_END=898 /DNA_ORIENTATION=+
MSGKILSSSTQSAVRSTAASGAIVYEGIRAVNEYLLFHYGNDKILLPYAFGPKEAMNFPARCGSLCSSWNRQSEVGRPSRALDLGCAVGGSSFELSRHFENVIGIDFSNHFIDAANDMKNKKELTVEILEQGQIFQQHTVILPEGIVPEKVQFLQGDACNLNPDIGQFDMILASNLLCRLPSPRKFITDIPNFLLPGGHLILISPYSWLEEYTPVNEWFGGCVVNSEELDSFVELKDFIGNTLELKHREDMPFLIREHARKFQYGVSDCTVWQKAA